jgi:hypothetical protein
LDPSTAPGSLPQAVSPGSNAITPVSASERNRPATELFDQLFSKLIKDNQKDNTFWRNKQKFAQSGSGRLQNALLSASPRAVTRPPKWGALLCLV